MVEDRSMKEEKEERKNWETPVWGSHGRLPCQEKGKKLKTKKLRNSEACCTKEEKTEKEVNSGRRRRKANNKRRGPRK
jgi:hypothetical protein